MLCVALLGPTASGKSDFALRLASRLQGEILCLDSTTVYTGFDIGTSKPSTRDQKKIPHHLLNLCSPDKEFTAHDFVEQAEKTIPTVIERGRLPLVVGGTYFYLRALQQGMVPTGKYDTQTIEQIESDYFENEQLNLTQMHADLLKADPKAAKTIHAHDRYRLVRALALVRSGKKPSELKPEPRNPATRRHWLKYAITLPRHELTSRITQRTDQMLLAGLLKETKALRTQFPNAKALGSIGYAQACQHLDGKIDERQLRTQIIEATRQLAKRQITWLRSDPEIHFIDLGDLDRVQKDVENLLSIIRNAP